MGERCRSHHASAVECCARCHHGRCSSRAAIPGARQGQGSGVDGCCAGIGIGPSKGQGSGSGLCQGYRACSVRYRSGECRRCVQRTYGQCRGCTIVGHDPTGRTSQRTKAHRVAVQIQRTGRTHCDSGVHPERRSRTGLQRACIDGGTILIGIISCQY